MYREGADEGIKLFFEQEYRRAYEMWSDIHEHVPILREYAEKCESIVEFGVRTGNSTRAFLCTNAKLTSYDIIQDESVVRLFSLAKSIGKNVEYIIQDSLKVEIEPVDLIFIDTEHTYAQLSQELKLHGNKAKKYLIFHDTITFGGELNAAILEFLQENKDWWVKEFRKNNNGLTILERSNSEKIINSLNNLSQPINNLMQLSSSNL